MDEFFSIWNFVGRIRFTFNQSSVSSSLMYRASASTSSACSVSPSEFWVMSCSEWSLMWLYLWTLFMNFYCLVVACSGSEAIWVSLLCVRRALLGLPSALWHGCFTHGWDMPPFPADFAERVFCRAVLPMVRYEGVATVPAWNYFSSLGCGKQWLWCSSVLSYVADLVPAGCGICSQYLCWFACSLSRFMV